MQPFLANLQAFLARLSLRQKLLLGGVIVGVLGVLGGVAYWASRPDFTLLFGNLNATDANTIVEALQADNIEHQLRENGTAIYVPRPEVYELRLRFAAEGAVGDGTTGYELFDQGTLGMTDFMQRLNMKRALEGELARTIMSVEGVETARVHLVLPERSPFRQDQTPATASVVLHLKGNGRLDGPQIDGISALVSGAVEGMSPTDVSVLDARGNLLSDPNAGNDELTLTTNQLRIQRALEEHLMQKGQTMLDQVLGPGNALVRVAATLDFSRAVAESQTIDPESQTVISEERQEEADPAAGNANSTVRNFDLSRRTERTEKGVGDIAFLTVSVILDEKPAPPPTEEGGEAAEGAPATVPFSQEELTRIENLVKNAVGYSGQRGDSFTIQQFPFDTSEDQRLQDELASERMQNLVGQGLRYALLALALGLAFWLARTATRRVVTLQTGEQASTVLPDGTPAEWRRGDEETFYPPGLSGSSNNDDDDDVLVVEDVYTSKLTGEARARLKARHLMYEELRKHALEKPQEVADVIHTWIVSDLQRNNADFRRAR